MQRGVYGPRAANGELANSLENLGHALARRGERGDLDAAKRHLETSFVMRLALENGQEYPLVRTLGKLAGVYARTGDRQKAADAYARAKTLLDALPPETPHVARKKAKVDEALAKLKW